MKVNRARASQKLHHIDRSSWLLSTITLTCGALITAGVFMPWFHIAKSVWVVNLSYTASGWEMAAGNSLLLTAFSYYSGETFPQAYYVLTGGTLLIGCAVWPFVIQLLNRGHVRIAATVRGIATTIAALLSFSTAMWFISYILILHDHLKDSDISVDSFSFSYGIYITAAFSFLAMIAGIAAMINGVRKARCNNHRGTDGMPGDGDRIE